MSKEQDEVTFTEVKANNVDELETLLNKEEERLQGEWRNINN
jgi:hypothetical protein